MPCADDPRRCAGSSTIKRSSSRTVLAALVVHLVPARNATRRAALPPSDVPPHAGSPFARCHNATRLTRRRCVARIERCPSRCRPLRRSGVPYLLSRRKVGV